MLLPRQRRNDDEKYMYNLPPDYSHTCDVECEQLLWNWPGCDRTKLSDSFPSNPHSLAVTLNCMAAMACYAILLSLLGLTDLYNRKLRPVAVKSRTVYSFRHTRALGQCSWMGAAGSRNLRFDNITQQITRSVCAFCEVALRFPKRTFRQVWRPGTRDLVFRNFLYGVAFLGFPYKSVLRRCWYGAPSGVWSQEFLLKRGKILLLERKSSLCVCVCQINQTTFFVVFFLEGVFLVDVACCKLDLYWQNREFREKEC